MGPELFLIPNPVPKVLSPKFWDTQAELAVGPAMIVSAALGGWVAA